MGNIEPLRKNDGHEEKKPHDLFADAVNGLSKGGKVAIFTQDNPDPDAIGSAHGLAWLIKKLNSSVSTTIFYGGEISHPQNRTLVNLLNISMKKVDSQKDYSDYKAAIFSRYRTLSELLGGLLLREAQKVNINCLMESSGKDVGM